MPSRKTLKIKGILAPQLFGPHILGSRTTTSRSSRSSKHSHISGKSSNGYDLVVCLLELLMSVKFYHWRTNNYSTHKATDELYGDLNDNIDEFAETLMGVMGTRIPATNKLHLVIPSDNKHMLSLIDRSVKMLSDFDFNKLAKTAHTSTTDLMNIRDEMIGHLHQTQYLLTLNGGKK
jgi:DNA-binding ferritin-like protein